MSEPRLIVVDADRTFAAMPGRIAQSMQVPFDIFATAEEMLEFGTYASGGVIVSEFRLLGINGIDMQQKLNELNSNNQMVFHTAFAQTWLTVIAMQRGAFAVFDKPADEHELTGAIELAMDRFLSTHRQQAVTTQLRKNIDLLNERQRNVLRLLIEGAPNKVMARRLDVSIRTVESCRHVIFETTKMQSIAELVKEVTLANIDLRQTSA